MLLYNVKMMHKNFVFSVRFEPVMPGQRFGQKNSILKNRNYPIFSFAQIFANGSRSKAKVPSVEGLEYTLKLRMFQTNKLFSDKYLR